MKKIRKILTVQKLSASIALLAMILSFLSHITPLWAQQVNGTPIVICSTYGTKTIFIDENGNKLPDTPEYKIFRCTMCLNASMAFITATTDTYISPVYFPKIYTGIIGNKDIIHLKKIQPYINGIRAPPAAIPA